MADSSRNTVVESYDVRIADWRFLYAPLLTDRCAIVGDGATAEAAALTGEFATVVVVDPSLAHGTNSPKMSAESRTVCRVVMHPAQLRFAARSLDCIVFTPSSGVSLQRALGSFVHALTPGGVGILRVANRWGVNRLRSSRPLSTATGIREIQSEVARSGLRLLGVHGLVPDFRGVPLFLLPIGTPEAARHFLRHSARLVRTVPPGVRKPYRVEVALVRIASAFSGRLPIGRLLEAGAPGFLVAVQAGEAHGRA